MELLTLILMLFAAAAIGVAAALAVVHFGGKRKAAESLEDRMTSIEEQVLSTVRSLNFFDQATGKKITTARLTSRPARIIDEVAEGNINMRLLPSSAGLASTLASMAAEKGSKLKRHSHQHYVDIFIAEGRVTVAYDNRSEAVEKGGSLHFEPGVQKTLTFDRNSVLIWTFTPALDEIKETGK